MLSSVWQQCPRLVSGLTVTQGVVMQSPASIRRGFLPSATVRQVMSRSVITPMGIPAALSTGISPQSLSTIILATSDRLVSGKQ